MEWLFGLVLLLSLIVGVCGAVGFLLALGRFARWLKARKARRDRNINT